MAKVWDLSTRKEIAKLEGHAGPVVAVAFSHGRHATGVGGDGQGDQGLGRKTREQASVLTTSPAASPALAWVDAKTLLSASDDGVPRFSSRENKTRAIKTFSGGGGRALCAAVTADGKTIFGACHDGRSTCGRPRAEKLEGTLTHSGVK